jgi:hypothetical protein
MSSQGSAERKITEPALRFWKSVFKTDKCWLWTGNKIPSGYGYFSVRRNRFRVHRFAYELVNGPILSGLDIDHLCGVRNCVNPAHLEAVTHRDNVLRGNTFAARNVAKTSCPSGHPYDGENTYLDGRSRHCKICMRIGLRRRYQANPSLGAQKRRESRARQKERE